MDRAGDGGTHRRINEEELVQALRVVRAINAQRLFEHTNGGGVGCGAEIGQVKHHHLTGDRFAQRLTRHVHSVQGVGAVVASRGVALGHNNNEKKRGKNRKREGMRGGCDRQRG